MTKCFFNILLILKNETIDGLEKLVAMVDLKGGRFRGCNALVGQFYQRKWNSRHNIEHWIHFSDWMMYKLVMIDCNLQMKLLDPPVLPVLNYLRTLGFIVNIVIYVLRLYNPVNGWSRA